jgi:hypothetical protein
MNINPETGEATNTGRSPRFTLWVAFLVFSTITMISSVEEVSVIFWSHERAEGVALVRNFGIIISKWPTLCNRTIGQCWIA